MKMIIGVAANVFWENADSGLCDGGTGIKKKIIVPLPRKDIVPVVLRVLDVIKKPHIH
jgi:hypothetical protein